MTWVSRTTTAITPVYASALHGLYPTHFGAVTALTLAQDGWLPPWVGVSASWAQSAPVAATWTLNTPVAATWTERT